MREHRPVLDPPIEGTDAMNPHQITSKADRSAISRAIANPTTTVPEIADFDTVREAEMSNSATATARTSQGPTIENGTVVPFAIPGARRAPQKPSEDRRAYLTEREVEQLCDAAVLAGATVTGTPP
jgi:hypothetical protein